ncbi:MAG: hypothetical protein KF860_14635 [Cyclobacteriaceae bacterium]|nr:hypothetical protein [Cyclobacteriaceae bacterium]
MKKSTLYYTASLVALLFFFTSCSTEKHKDNQNQGEEVHDTHGAPGGVQLDNGNKWMANIETTQGIQNMAQMVDVALADPASSAAPLKENLLLEFTDILNKCTMTGESHEQLHNYLLPLKDQIENLDETDKNAALGEIKSYLSTYKNYFE